MVVVGVWVVEELVSGQVQLALEQESASYNEDKERFFLQVPVFQQCPSGNLGN